jgi:iron complex outermembrane receptor protein
MQKHDLGHANRSFGNIRIDYSLPFLPALHISWNGGYDASKGWGTVHWPADAAAEWSTTTNHGYNSQYLSKTMNTVSEVNLTFNKDIASIKSNINAVAGYGYYDYKTTNYNYANLDAKGDTIPGSAPTYPYDIPRNTLISYYGRLIYTFHDKYILMGSLRTDGSSRFAPAYRWGVFPAASLAWRINQEPFLKNSRVLSDLKVRVSYGETGNQAGIDDYAYLPDYSLSLSSSQYQLGDKFYSMYTPAYYTGNLQWEQTASTDVGIDYGFLNGRISGSIDYYHKNTSNLLDKIDIPEGTNFTNILLTNIGAMTSKGVEFSVNAIPVQHSNLTWNVSFNMAYNRSTITKLRSSGNATFQGDLTGPIGGATGQTIQIESVGYDPMAYYIYKQIYDPKTGMPIEGLYEDLNRDGIINSDDQYRYKSPLPIFTYGFSTSLNYRKWTLSTVLRAEVGNYVYNNVAASLGVQRTIINPVGILVNATTDIYKTGFYNNEYHSDYYIQNGSFLRMDNLGVDYKVLSDNNMNLSLALHCQNVFTLTKYTGLDPEIYNGIDNNLYPRPRVITLGANLEF